MKQRLFEHLNDHLPDSTKRQLSSQAIQDIVHCVVGWIEKERLGLSIIDKARNLPGVVNKSREIALKTVTTDPEFMTELGKL